MQTYQPTARPNACRFGALPLVCQHYCEASWRWEIAGLGIFELYTPATPLSTQVGKGGRKRGAGAPQRRK